ncbi:ribokinase [Clostridium sp. JNZ J1-5]|nr:ribokinase [Clostridium sp.]
MNKVCILGSINMDIILNVKRMPAIGETIFGEDIKNAGGGKGANQAVASKRSGAEVFMVGKVGKDKNGEELTASLVNDNINVDYIFKDNTVPTGTAVITVSEEGNNSIIVVPGANMTITSEEMDKAKKAIELCHMVIAQFETPIDTTIEAFKYAKESGKITILNPAPAKNIPSELYKYTDVIIPNETEISELTGIKVENLEEAKLGADKFLEEGVKYVIVTLGEKGAALITKDKAEIIPAYKVNAVDTTAAGDSFIGGLSSKLDVANFNYNSLKEAIIFGNKVSSIVVQKEGAQPSIPYLKDVIEIYGEE